MWAHGRKSDKPLWKKSDRICNQFSGIRAPKWLIRNRLKFGSIRSTTDFSLGSEMVNTTNNEICLRSSICNLICNSIWSHFENGRKRRDAFSWVNTLLHFPSGRIVWDLSLISMWSTSHRIESMAWSHFETLDRRVFVCACMCEMNLTKGALYNFHWTSCACVIIISHNFEFLARSAFVSVPHFISFFFSLHVGFF